MIDNCLFISSSGASGVETVSVMEGDSVTLHTGVKTNQQNRIRWYYNNIRIAQIRGDLSNICTDVKCNDGNERFRETGAGSSDWISDHQKHQQHRLWTLSSTDQQQQK